MAAGEAGVIGYQLCCQPVEIERIYTMHKQAVGLLSNSKSAAKPIPFAEDACVPTRHLGGLYSHQLNYGMFTAMWRRRTAYTSGAGYVRSGTRMLMKRLSDRIVALTAKYGSLLNGAWQGIARRVQPSVLATSSTMSRATLKRCSISTTS
ncbi:MAG: hypothetical protein GPOALKHO_000608 [Sodalis sp.]|uniref:hypothetical protein n=1 Tax=Sodalis sp. (in: enterobacteria) TaxID=1898979 RepID=UPI003872BF87|nr:MAG: hypothetical protein GPOALKHO_000608 [Sodalis sp.]